MNNLEESLKMYNPSATETVRWVEINTISANDRQKLYDWSREYVRKCVMVPESLTFPSIDAVKFYTNTRVENEFKIEYIARGKDCYSNTVQYPVCLLFENASDPVFLSITLE